MAQNGVKFNTLPQAPPSKSGELLNLIYSKIYLGRYHVEGNANRLHTSEGCYN
jgi:hypothetical protein